MRTKSCSTNHPKHTFSKILKEAIFTRRRAACELIRTLLSAFPQRVGPLFASEVEGLLQKGESDWKAFDCAIFLVTALALQGNSGNTQRGAKQVLNPMIPFESFLTSQILPQLGTPVGPTSHLIIKADAIRFVTTFRSHIRPDLFSGILAILFTGWGRTMRS